MTERLGTCAMVTTDDGHIIIVSRKWRSKWWTAICTCGRSRRRKDGTCKHLRELRDDPRVRPTVQQHLKLDPLPMKERNRENEAAHD